MSNLSHKNVSGKLINWYLKNHRALPWRKTTDPYPIWISEIILQQTRVEQGTPYYNRFLERFPTLRDLAESSENEVLKQWQGLGYYSRARNMHFTARDIARRLKGKFPESYDELIQLKGIGSYTAAAIASMAFREPRAVVDGNVYRVLARLFNEPTPIDAAAGKQLFARLAAELMDPEKPGLHNQAIMELGALVCKPVDPICPECPIRVHCLAYPAGTIQDLPVKTKSAKITIRHFNYLLIKNGKHFYMCKRGAGDIWHNLYQLPLIETPKATTLAGIMKLKTWKQIFKNQQVHMEAVVDFPVHKLSHQHIHSKLLVMNADPAISRQQKELWVRVTAQKAHALPVPKLIQTMLNAVLPAYKTAPKASV